MPRRYSGSILPPHSQSYLRFPPNFFQLRWQLLAPATTSAVMSEQKTPPNAADKSEKRPRQSNASKAAKELLERIRKRRAEREARERARPGPRLEISMRPTERILLDLKHHGQEVFGLKVYRLTYEDDAAWRKFMDLLNSETRSRLTGERALPEGEELLSMLDWAVEDNKEVWNGASFEQVFRYVLRIHSRFKRLLTFFKAFPVHSRDSRSPSAASSVHRRR